MVNWRRARSAMPHGANPARPLCGGVSGGPRSRSRPSLVGSVVGLVSIGGDEVTAVTGRKLDDDRRRLGCGGLMRGMLPIRHASGRESVATVVGKDNDCLAHVGSVLGHYGQLVQETN